MQILFKSLVLLSILLIAGCATVPNKVKEYDALGPFQHQTPTHKILVNLPELDQEVITLYFFMMEKMKIVQILLMMVILTLQCQYL